MCKYVCLYILCSKYIINNEYSLKVKQMKKRLMGSNFWNTFENAFNEKKNSKP